MPNANFGLFTERTHRAPPKEDGTPVPVGYLIMSTLRDAILSDYQDKITIMTSCKVVELMHGERDCYKFIHGVKYEAEGKIATMSADCVVLATGGFGYGKLKACFCCLYRRCLKT